MENIAPVENTIWKKDKRIVPAIRNDDDINERYTRGEGRILIETNRERIQVFVESLRRPGYLELQPFYQRRQKWDEARSSLLIESFIMNIPVPPVFLYEKEFGRYEVMDGQQRITTLRDFYDDRITLRGLEHWPELNGRKYSTLPSKVRAGIDRRSLSSIVLLKESASDDEEVSLLRRTVFDRLNRGGIKLGRQEIRNALFASPFNQLLHELAENEPFRSVWISDEEAADDSEASNSFQRMDDIEVVLRFFALRHQAHIRGSLQDFLDTYMARMQAAKEEDIVFLRMLFLNTMNLGVDIYKSNLFRPWDKKKGNWQGKPNKGFSDCVLTGLASVISRADVIRAKRDQIVEDTKRLFEEHEEGTFTGRKSTKQDLLDRLARYRKILEDV